jgi:hypothetical protein
MNVKTEMTIKFVEESCVLKGAKVSISLFILENASLVLVTDINNEYRISSIALAMPVTGTVGETSPSILTLFGSGKGLLARAIAGRISNKMGKAALSIVGLKEDDLGTISVIMKEADVILARMQTS